MNHSPVIPAIQVPDQPAPLSLNAQEKQAYVDRIAALLKAKNAVLIAHYYTDASIQELAEQTGGFVGDSLAMAQFGAEHPATTLLVSGVRFMGETAKILSPQKTVLVPSLEAECSLDLACPADAFQRYIDAHPDRTVVVYANTSAAVKAMSDWVVTSRIGVDVVRHLHEQGEKVLWAPDRYLGSYIQQTTGADMLIWPGACVVHEEFKIEALRDLMAKHPEAAVLVHPESPEAVVAVADVVGSTSELLRAVESMDNPSFIVATDRGIFYKMQQLAAGRELILAPTGGRGATCKSCGHCPWMAMSHLENVAQVLETGENTIELDEALMAKALKPLQRMVDFNA